MQTTLAPASAIPVGDLGPFVSETAGALEATAADLRHICETIGLCRP
jgi:hypothetical protein